MIAKRRPGPKRIASSSSATVATSSCTSHSASRHIASSMRSATKPSSSRRSASGSMPTARYIAAARAVVSGAVRSPRHDLDQRQQVDGVEGVRHAQALGPLQARRRCRRQQARRRRADDRVGLQRALDRRQQLLLELQPLGRALLHQLGAGDGGLRRVDQLQPALRGQRRERQPPVGAPARVVDHLADLARRLGVGVVDAHVDPVEHEARRPAAADDAAAEQADPARGPTRAHAGPRSRSRSRTSAGPRTRTFIASRIATARSTSCAVGGEDAAREVDVVLQPDPHVAARQHRHGDERAAPCGRSRRRRRPLPGAARARARAASRDRPARRTGCPCRAGSARGRRSARRA